MEHHREHYMVSNPETSDLKVTITQNVCSSSTLGGTGDSNTKDGESGYGWRRRIELRRNLKVKKITMMKKQKVSVLFIAIWRSGKKVPWDKSV